MLKMKRKVKEIWRVKSSLCSLGTFSHGSFTLPRHFPITFLTYLNRLCLSMKEEENQQIFNETKKGNQSFNRVK